MSNDVIISVEHLSKRYRLGEIGATTLRESAERWWHKLRGRDPAEHMGVVGAGSRKAVTETTIDGKEKIEHQDREGSEGKEETGKSLVSEEHKPLRSLRSSVQNVFDDDLWALKDVSFEVKRGEVLGIIGRNGAGKSTLLKILSRITEPTSGRAVMRGRVGSLLEVGTGFHPELTGRENIFLNGAILGMKKKEIEAKFDEIVAFSEIERFIDTPVKRYSSGMYVRLAFAVAAHLDPEILLVDEVLAVGDAAFQKKCMGKMGDVAKAGRTVLFVSHNMGAIRQLCPKAIWLDEGEIRDVGASGALVTSYIKGVDTAGGAPEVDFEEISWKEAQLRRVRLLNTTGELTQKFSCDEPVVLELLFQVRHSLPGLYGYMEIAKMDGTSVMTSDSLDSVPNPMDHLSIGLHTLNVTVPARTLAAGDYTVYLAFGCLAADTFLVDCPQIVCSFSLDDMTSKRGNKRNGFFSTLLSWHEQRDS